MRLLKIPMKMFTSNKNIKSWDKNFRLKISDSMLVKFSCEVSRFKHIKAKNLNMV